MPTTAEMLPPKQGSCDRISEPQKSGSLTQSVIYHQRAVVPVYLSLLLIGVLEQDWIFIMGLLSVTAPSLVFHDLGDVIPGPPDGRQTLTMQK